MAAPGLNCKTHRDLIDEACMQFARAEQRRNPGLSLPRALAAGRRALAERLRIKEHAIRRMREVGRVSPWHWEPIERATAGQIKAADFERAQHDLEQVANE